MAILKVAEKDVTYPITDRPLVIGRSSQCDIVIDDERLSRKHCEIGQNEEGYYLKDLNSFNGTYVNEEKVHFQILTPNDQIKIGKTVFIFSSEGDTHSYPILQITQNQKNLYTIPLEPNESYSLGRSAINSLCLQDKNISSTHANIFYKDNSWWIQDLHSKNGTLLNEETITISPLKIGDVVRLGNVCCVVQQRVFKPKSLARVSNFKWVAIATVLLVFSVCSIVAITFFKQPSLYLTTEDNLVENASFETHLGWELQGNIKINDHIARTGKASVDMSSSNFGERNAVYREYIMVSDDKLYQGSIWTNFKDLQGLAGLRMTWLDNKLQAIGSRFYIPLAQGNSDGWQKFEFTTRPAPNAEKLQISCFALGRASFLYIDDVMLIPQQNNKFSSDRLFQHPWQVRLTSCATSDIYYNDQLLFKCQFDSAIGLGKTSSSNQSLLWEGTVNSADQFRNLAMGRLQWSSLEDGVSLRVELTPRENNSERLEYVLALPQISENDKIRVGNSEGWRYLSKDFTAGYSWNMDVKYEQELGNNSISQNIHRVFADNGSNLPPTASISTEEKKRMWKITDAVNKRHYFILREGNALKVYVSAILIQYLVWEKLKNQAALFYSQQLPCYFTADRHELYIHHVLPTDAFTLEFKTCTNSEKYHALFAELKKQAREYEEREQFGLAYPCYQKMIGDVSFHPETPDILKKVAQLQNGFQENLNQVVQRFDRAKFLQHIEAYTQLNRLCREVTQKWQGFPGMEKLREVSEQIQREYEPIEQEQREKASQQLLKRAQDLDNEQFPALAWICYCEILENYADTTARENALLRVEEVRKRLPGVFTEKKSK